MSNCLFYAIGKLWREGGYIIMRRSHRGWWPHFFWSADLIEFEEYAPEFPKTNLLCPPPIFKGIIKRRNPMYELI